MKMHWFSSVMVCLMCLCNPPVASAQEIDARPLEFGVQFSRLDLGWAPIQSVEPGVGGWIGYGLNDHVFLDGQVDVFPRAAAPGGRQFQVAAGVKSGWRFERWGVFGKIRPGIARFGQPFGACPRNSFCALVISPPVHRTNFMLDLGGVFEVYPTARTVLRTDVGDTLIRFGWDGPSGTDAKESSHNLRISIGGGLRF